MEIMEHLLGLVDAVRQIRGNYSLPPQQSLKVTAHFDQADAAQALIPHASIALGLERFAALNLGASFPKPSFSASGLIPGGKVYVELEGILDPAAERVRLTKELEKTRNYAAVQEKKLANEKFVQSAPAEVVEGEREKLRSQIEAARKLEAALADLDA
jgi:valyl-tRNA synthetase